MNTQLINFLWLLLFFPTLIYSQAPIWPLNPTNWNKISCTFSELHGTSADHVHAALDINCDANDDPLDANGNPIPITSTRFRAVLDGQIEGLVIGKYAFLTTIHDYPSGQPDEYLKKIRYGDFTRYINSYSDGDDILQSSEIGKVIDGGHLHFEMWIRETVSSPWRRVNPLGNPNANYTNLPPNEPDTWDPELNDVVLHGISEPTGTNSGIIANGTGIVNGFQGNHTRVHFINHPGQANINGLPYNPTASRIIIYGSIGSIIHERDVRVTNPPYAIGTGLGIDAATFNIDGQEKYRVKFDEILETELTSTTDFYATTFDAPMAFGNNDYLKMRRITGETARSPHKLINGIRSNGVWATRAKIGSPNVFATTPTEVAICPDDAKYPDGNHTLSFTVSDAAGNTNNATVIPIVDNFKPYIKSVTITANGKSYTRNVECSTCGIQLGAAVGDPFTSADLANGFKVSVTTSEPMNTLLFTVTAAGVSQTTSVLSADKQNYVFNIPANGNLQSSGKVALSFYGTDMADNQILNFANASGCKALPVRTGTNSWTSTTLGSGTETSFSFPICNDELIVPLNGSIVPASSCSVADGKIQPSIPAGVTTTGLTFEWFWYFNGTWETIGKGINPFILNTLKSGEYKVVVTNTSGCKGEKKFSVSSPNDIMVKFSELAPCIGTSNGSLTVNVTSKNINGYDIYWAGPGIIPVTSPVVTGKTSSTINNLAPGKYQVFVSKTGTPLDGCARVFEYDLKISNFTSSDITAIVKNPCQSKINSIIKLDYSKFGVPHTIKWDLPVPVSKQSSQNIWDLGTGIYTVNVTNHCGQKATKSFELKEVGIATIKVETKDCKSDLSVDFPNANQPVKYSWAYGKLSYDAVIKDIKTNSANVIVTDANGCKSTSSIDEVPFYEFVKRDACAGATGQLSIDVHNPSGASPLTATILVPLGFSDHNLNFFPSDHHLSNTNPLTGLKVGDKIPIELTIGTCKINETIEILEKPTIKKFNSATDTKCYYDEECNGNTCSKCIEKVGINSSFNQSNFTGAFAKCSYNLLCPDLEKGGGATFAAGAKSYSKKFMRVGEYVVLLSAAVQSGIISQSQMDLYLGMIDQESICSFVLVCMADLTPRGNPMSSIFCKGKGPSPTSTPNCFTMTCGCLFKYNVNFCLKDISPKWSIDFENIELQTCDYKQYSVHEIIMWEKQLVAKYPTTYPLSTLAEFIASVKKDSDLLQKSVCATVSFCSNNFKFLSSNIKTIDCKPNFGPDEDPSARTDSYPPCTFITQKVKGDYDIVACKGKGVKKHNKNMPSFFTSSPVASKEVILDPYHAVGKLNHFGIAISEDAVMPRGFVETNEGEMKYYDYTVEEESGTFYDTKNIYFSFEDAINNTLTYISKNGENEYMVNFEGDNGLWYHSLSSMSNLTIKKLSKNKDIISVLGTFSGNLDYKSNTIAKSETTSVFLLKLGIEGEITFLKTIDGYKSNTDMVVLEGLDDLGLTTVFDADNTKIDGSGLSTNQKNGIVSILGDKQNIFCTFDANSNIKILKASASKFDNSQIFVLAGIGTINTINTNIKVNDDSYTIINFDDKGDVSWKSTFLKQSIDVDKIGIIKNKDGNTYLALTFENQIEIQGQFFKSEGKKDILFIMLDGKGNIKNTQQFGSEDDENAHEFLYDPEGALFFGGEVNGSEKVLPIGSRNFIKLSETFEQPYISYILDSDFEGIITKQMNNKNFTTTKTSQLSNEIDINIYPNPFNDNLNVFIKCDIICDYEVRLMNTLGSTLWQQKSENTKDNATFEITTAQQLPNGVYFIEVKNSDGKIIVHRVVKN